jgi:XTP/dITP diphosphohydrolase
VRLVVATRSPDKLREIRRILADVPGIRLMDLNDAGIPPSPEEEAIEAFETFTENASAKARHFYERTGIPTVADDSGLEVDALGGRPGVHSKRFAPVGPTVSGGDRDRANNEHLLELLGDLDLARRTARYVCVAALESGEEDPVLFRGECEGRILGRPRGHGGFGYDPIFLDPASGRSFGELTPQEKQERSHRGAAFRAVAAYLKGEGGRQG